jgi:mono/diheme cytochrome c family protein
VTRWLVVCAVIAAPAAAQDFDPAAVRKGAAIYEQNCGPCHGARMLDPNSAFDLRTFPPDQKSRFVHSVTKGLNSMPPWGDILKPDDIEALWAYVRAGEK